MAVDTKCCQVCHEDKPFDCFSRDQSKPDGRQTRCKACYKNYYDKNSDIIRARIRQWVSENSEHVKTKKQEDYANNREARIKQSTEYALANPEKHHVWLRKSHLRKMYGMTLEQFDSLLREQDSVCAVCGRTEPGGRGTWHVDHDHSCCPGRASCGKCVRGLLCQKCNAGLGSFDDSIDVLEKALAYLKREPTRE